MKTVEKIREFLDDRITSFDGLSPTDRRLLVSLAIREAKKCEVFEYITETPRSDELPMLLADVLAARNEKEEQEAKCKLLEAVINGAMQYAQNQMNEKFFRLNDLWR